MRISEYMHMAYTRGAFECQGLDHAYAGRAADAIVKRDLRLLSEPLIKPHRTMPYIYTGEEVYHACTRLGIVLLVKRIISEIDKLLAGGQIQAMLEKVTTNPEEQAELLARIAFAIERVNPAFLKGNLGMLREEELQQKLLESGILRFMQMMMDE